MDRLYLSVWVRNFRESNMLGHFEKMLSVFPFSKLAKRGPQLRIYAIDHSEPPLLEREFPPGTDPKEMIDAAREFAHDDCLYEIDTAWDLWQLTDDWKLSPAPVILSCIAPAFEDGIGDHLRIDFGPDELFIPNLEIEGSPRLVQSNLKSLIYLVHEIERVVDVERRELWSESGLTPVELVSRAL
jgi:hypothetical protein